MVRVACLLQQQAQRVQALLQLLQRQQQGLHLLLPVAVPRQQLLLQPLLLLVRPPGMQR
jgi:hypothetical protein